MLPSRRLVCNVYVRVRAHQRLVFGTLSPMGLIVLVLYGQAASVHAEQTVVLPPLP